MHIKSVLLALTTYPEPSPVSTVKEAVEFTQALGARISAIACETEIAVPGRVSKVVDKIIDIPLLGAAELKKSIGNASDLLAAFETEARKQGVFQEAMRPRFFAHDVPYRLAEYARFSDLTLVPVPEGDFVDQWYAESIIFGAGRAVVIMPYTRRTERPVSLNTVAIAWDFSRNAARAVGDALPLLEKAKLVRVFTVTNEKMFDWTHSGEELAKFLARHGISVILDKIDAGGKKIGDVFEAYIAAHRVDLLVMGAYGHSKFRQFILGGATRQMLTHPPIPILMSY